MVTIFGVHTRRKIPSVPHIIWSSVLTNGSVRICDLVEVANDYSLCAGDKRIFSGDDLSAVIEYKNSTFYRIVA